MSGAFACACSNAEPKTMADPSSLRRSGQLYTADGKPSWPRGGRLSRAERMEIFCCIAATGMSDCPAWIIPMLERSDPNED